MKDEFIRILTVLDITKQVEYEKFQKIIYILKQQKASFDEKFIYGNDGVYSTDLGIELKYLVDTNIIKEQQWLPVDTQKYLFKTNWNKQERKIITKLIKNSDVNTNKYRDIIKFLNIEPTSIVRIISTIYYLQNKGYYESNHIKRKLSVLESHLPDKIKQIERAYKLYNQLPIII